VSLDAILKRVSSLDLGSLWTPTSLEAMGRRAAAALLFRDDQAVCGGKTPIDACDEDTVLTPTKIAGVSDATPVPMGLLADIDLAAGVGLPVPIDGPVPAFLPMFPWYSGTSADLLKTLFDLVVSLKVFLGRFDLRTLEAATAGLGGEGAAPSAAGGALPKDGDGYTFEHLSGKEEVWIDFCADTGDGGDPTYSVARCMAARSVTVEVPESAEAEGIKAGGVRGNKVRVLPRASALIHGGDLAYPNPTGKYVDMCVCVCIRSA